MIGGDWEGNSAFATGEKGACEGGGNVFAPGNMVRVSPEG